jgi:hypothetical protein
MLTVGHLSRSSLRVYTTFEFLILHHLVLQPRFFCCEDHQMRPQNIFWRYSQLALVSCGNRIHKAPHDTSVTSAVSATFRTWGVQDRLIGDKGCHGEGGHVANNLASRAMNSGLSFANVLCECDLSNGHSERIRSILSVLDIRAVKVCLAGLTIVKPAVTPFSYCTFTTC